MTEFDHVNDSGTRQEFSTGAVRDAQSGKGRYDLLLSLSHMFYRLARHFENGAVKYGDDNWRKGLPLRRFIDSAFRHLCQYVNGGEDEDHLTAAIWNLMCHGETMNEIKAGRLPAELDDMPHYAKQSSGITAEQHKELIMTTLADHPYIKGNKITTESAVEPKTFYITGPMRGIPFFNFPMFDNAAELAREHGYDIISPAELDREHGMDPINDPCSIDRAFEADPNLVQTLAQRDCEVILNLKKDRGDGLILLPGWEESTGARAEIALALWLGLTFEGFVPRNTIKDFLPYFTDLASRDVKYSLFHQRDLI